MSSGRYRITIFAFFAIGAIVVLAVFWYFSGRAYDITNYPPKSRVVVALGDSLTEGAGASPGNDYVSVLSRTLGLSIINAGVSGDTTEDGLRRLERDALARDPGVVIVLLGGNDYLRRLPKETTFGNLGKIIDRIHAKEAVVVLVGVRGGLLGDSYAKDYETLARAKKTAFVPNVLADVLGEPDLMYDTIHPNDKGYAIVAQAIAPVLESVLE